MKIVQIEDFFHPRAGYQVNFISKYFASEGHDVYIITEDMEKALPSLANFFGVDDIEKDDNDYCERTGVKQIIRVPSLCRLSSRHLLSRRLYSIINEISPDVLLVHGVETLTGIRFVYWNSSIPRIFDSHMTKIASVNRFAPLYERLFRITVARRINSKRYTVVRTTSDSYVNSYLGIDSALTPIIPLGTDTEIFKPDCITKQAFREVCGIHENDFVVIFTGKLIKDKGADYLPALFEEKIIGNNGREIVAIVIGDSVGEYGERLERKFQDCQTRVIRFPTQSVYDLPMFYQASDLFLIAKQCSLSMFDAQACGLPVMAEGNTINIERLSHGNGFIFEKDNVADMKLTLKRIVELSLSSWNQYCENSLAFANGDQSYKSISNEFLRYMKSEIADMQTVNSLKNRTEEM